MTLKNIGDIFSLLSKFYWKKNCLHIVCYAAVIYFSSCGHYSLCPFVFYELLCDIARHTAVPTFSPNHNRKHRNFLGLNSY